MSRSLTAAVETGSQQPNVTAILLAKLDFSSGMLYVTNMPYNVTPAWDGNTYVGGGNLVGVDPVSESADQQAHELKYRLAGIPPEYLSIALTEHYQGRDAFLYWALMDADHKVVSDPVLLFKGRMDSMEIVLGQQGVITLTAQSRLADWSRARVRRYNDADQQAEYPGDKFFEYQEQMVSVELLWGAAGTSPSPVQMPSQQESGVE
jgi:hypothetical protein